MALCRAPALRVAGRGAARPRAARRAPRRAAASAVAEEPRQQQGGAGAGEAPEGGAPVVIQSYAVSEPAATKEAKSFTTLRPESVALASKDRAVALAAGDAGALLLFAAIGRANHGEDGGLVGLLLTTLPFWIGWATAAYATDAYSVEKRTTEGSLAAISAAVPTWAMAVPFGVAMRALIKFQAPPAPFLIASFFSTAALIGAWRVAYDKLEPYEPGQAKRERDGNFFELFDMLGGLTDRW